MKFFDGHNDTLLQLWLEGDSTGTGFIHGSNHHIDVPKAKVGGLMGGFFAIFTPSLSPSDLDPKNRDASDKNILSTEMISQEKAHTSTQAMLNIITALSAYYPDIIRICRQHSDIIAACNDGVIAAIVHIEGAEAIAPDLSNFGSLYDQGLRSIGPLWSRANAFGEGVPLAFPASPDCGEGLTEAGKNLIHAANEWGVIIDLSHLNEKGFWDVAKISTNPLVATHSNCHSICPSPRNLTSKQLDAIAESGGMVGLNFAAGFLRPDGAKDPATELELMIRHLDLLIHHLGEDGVGLGSDFDGAIIPHAIGSAAGLPALTSAMQKAGYGNNLIEKICSKNWLRMIKIIIG